MERKKNRNAYARHSGSRTALAVAAALSLWMTADGPASAAMAQEPAAARAQQEASPAQPRRRERRKVIVNGKEIPEGKVIVNDGSGKSQAGGREITATWVDDLRQGELKAKNIELTDDGADVKAVSADGHFMLTEAQAGTSRQLKIERGEDGRLVRSYFVNGERREFDADARAWLSRTLRAYFQTQAEARAK